MSNIEIDNNSISKPVLEFLINNGIDLNNLSNIYNHNINCEKIAKQNDYDYTLTWGNIIFKNKQVQLVQVKDIIGSFGLRENEEFLKCVSFFYNENDTYGERSINYLKTDMLSNVESILKLEKPLKLVEIGGKYYIGQDGNHRAFYLLLAYLTLKEKYKDNIEMLNKIENAFLVKAEVTKKSEYESINKISYCLSKCWNDDIKISFDIESDAICLLTIDNKTYEIKNEQIFLQYFNNYLSTLDKNSSKYNELYAELVNIGYYDTPAIVL